MLATTAGFLIMARSALADMTMTFFSTASLATLWMAVETTGRRRFAWLILAGAAAGLAMLAKGPAPALVLPVPYAAAAGIIIARLIRQRRITTPLSPGGRGAGGEGAVSTPLSPRGRGAGGEGADLGWTIAGTLAASAVFLAIALPWPLAVYAQVPDALRIWKAESVDRSTGDFGHEEPIYFYVIRLPVLLLPWTVFFAYGAVLAIRRWREEAAARAWLFFLGAWIVGPLVAFSLAAGKQDHYILPIIPAAALYSAIAVGHLFGSSAPKVQRAARRLIIGHAVLIGLALLVPLMWGPRGAAYVRAPLLWTTILLAAFLGPLAAYVLARLGRPSTGMVSLITSIALAFFFAWVALIGPSGPASSAADFGRRLSWAVPKEAELYAYPSANTTIAITVFYAGRPVPPLPRAAETRAAIAASRTLYVVCRDRDLKALEGVAHFVRLWRVPSEANDFWLMTSAAAVPQP
jgi:4-amino-4-deoxy-L-arabinose transferase-like glycosyltransferase